MSDWVYRKDTSMPYQMWKPFPDEALVQVSSYYEDVPDVIGLVKNFWWGYEEEVGQVGEGVIKRARRLDRPLRG